MTRLSPFVRLCNRMPYCPLAPVDSAAVTNSSDVPKCRRLFIFDVLLRCLRDYAPGNDSINGGGMLFTGSKLLSFTRNNA